MPLYTLSQVCSMNEEVTLTMSDVPLFAKKDKTNEAVTWRIMDFQPK